MLFAGGCRFLRNTLGFDLDGLDWELIWPMVVIILGASIVLGVRTGSHGGEPRT